MHLLGIERIIATNTVGAITLNYNVEDIVIPNDFIDFTRCIPVTFYSASITHIDLTEPYCNELRELLVVTSKEKVKPDKVRSNAVYVCTEGPRYETPAETKMFRSSGGDIIGMTGQPESVLARELEICYASLSFISNIASGLQTCLRAEEVTEKIKEYTPVIQQILKEVVVNIPNRRKCSCSNALEGARV